MHYTEDIQQRVEDIATEKPNVFIRSPTGQSTSFGRGWIYTTNIIKEFIGVSKI